MPNILDLHEPVWLLDRIEHCQRSDFESQKPLGGHRTDPKRMLS
jgi:hypothetical protein